MSFTLNEAASRRAQAPCGKLGESGVAVTSLRKQYWEYLTLRGYSERAIESYVGAVAGLVKHYWRSPEKIRRAEVRDYLLGLQCGSPNTSQSPGAVRPFRQGDRLSACHCPPGFQAWGEPSPPLPSVRGRLMIPHESGSPNTSNTAVSPGIPPRSRGWARALEPSGVR